MFLYLNHPCDLWWTQCSMSMSLLHWRAQTGTQNSRCVPSVINRGWESPPWQYFPSCSPGCCKSFYDKKCILLAHGQPLVHKDCWDIFWWLQHLCCMSFLLSGCRILHFSCCTTSRKDQQWSSCQPISPDHGFPLNGSTTLWYISYFLFFYHACEGWHFLSCSFSSSRSFMKLLNNIVSSTDPSPLVTGIWMGFVLLVTAFLIKAAFQTVFSLSHCPYI